MIGILISVFNFYLSFICKNKNKGSGIPMFGSLILLISLFFIDKDYLLIILTIVIILDTGGIHWFIGMMLWQHHQRDNL